MHKRVFISYRRSDALKEADEIAELLSRFLAKDSVFLDREYIRSGEDFDHVILNQVAACNVMIALVSKDWDTTKGIIESNRFDDPNDYVRRELELAIKLGKTVIPVMLIGSRDLPKYNLPPTLRGLTSKQAISVGSEGMPPAVGRIMIDNGVALISYERLIEVLRDYSFIAEWEPNISKKRSTINQYCRVMHGERIAGLLDLTASGDARHFLVFSTGGIYHRNIGQDTTFHAYGKIKRIDLDLRRSSLVLNDHALNISGTSEEDALSLVKSLVRLYQS